MNYEKTTTASRREDRRDSMIFAHVSCGACMIPNPKHTAENPLPPSLRMLPYISKGITYDRNINKRKMMLRSLGGAK